ncbi:unnamed protein product [Thelazia callipaeda]|uniref:Anoctamin n=1 Tax=Thelazia callipaeda TaxID=103827 RepID=A0A0N5CTM8_THECL|nr:unnamed protein product [Thelazia callipaeda]
MYVSASNFNASINDTKRSCRPLLFQLFWSPEVYIILPAFGIIREAILLLTDKERLFGQELLFEVIICILAATIIIAVPRAVKVFN